MMDPNQMMQQMQQMMMPMNYMQGQNADGTQGSPNQNMTAEQQL